MAKGFNVWVSASFCQNSPVHSPPKDVSAFPGRADKEAQTDARARLEENWVRVLTPEAPSLEPSLTICSPIADPDPGTQAAEEEEPQAPRNDALAELFLDILGGGGSTDDAEHPEPVWAAPPPAGAPEPARGGHGLHGGSPGKSPEGSSDSGYRNCAASSSRAVSLAPEQGQGDSQSLSSSQYKSLLPPRLLPSPSYRALVMGSLGPQADGQDGGRATIPQSSGYRSFSSLAGQPMASCPWPQEPLWDQAELMGGWPHCQEEGLLPPPLPGAPPGKAPDCPRPVDPRLPGYRPLWAACRAPSSLSAGSPYKPLLEAFGSVPREDPLEPPPRTWAAEREAWEVPLAWACSRGVEEEEESDPSREGVRPGTERSLPHVPLATS